MTVSNEFVLDATTNLCCLAKSSKDSSLKSINHILDNDVAILDSRNAQGETALHIASSSGNFSVVKILLDYGADMFLQDMESGWTALHRSLYHQHIHIAALLLRVCQLRFHRNKVDFFLQMKDHAGESAADIISFTHRTIAFRLSVSDFTGKKHHKQGISPNSDPTRRGGLVYTCGRADYQLGYHLPRALIQSTPKIVLFPSACPITQISASRFHTVALNANGHCFTWGFGKGGRLGLGTQCDHLEPAMVKKLAHVFLVKVAAGENHTLALSRYGKLYSWGSNSFGQLGHSSKCTLESRLFPKRIDALKGFVVREIAASRSHSAAICENRKAPQPSADKAFIEQEDETQRELFTWGNNKKGQLGRSEAFAIDHGDPIPKRVNLFLSHPVLSEMRENYDSVCVIQISIAEGHTLVLLNCTRNQVAQGQVWRCGNGYFHLVRVNFEKAKEAYRKSAFLATPPVNIIRISCARNHSMALDSRGQVYVWGSNKTICGQDLDTPAQPSYPGAPSKVKNICSFGSVVDISASDDRCAIVTESGDLVTWGYGLEGSLGHGSKNTYQPQPKRVSGVKKAVQVAAGHQHTAILVGPYEADFQCSPVQNTDGPTKLLEMTQRAIARYMDFTNVVDVLQHAQSMSLSALEAYCSTYIRWNLDMILEMTSRDRLDTFLDAFLDSLLPLPLANVIQKTPLNTIESQLHAPSARRVKVKTALQTLIASPKDILSKDLMSKETRASEQPVNSTTDEIAAESIGHREKKKRAKFVRLEEFYEKKRNDHDHHSADRKLFSGGKWSCLLEENTPKLKEIIENEKRSSKRSARPQKEHRKNSLACRLVSPIERYESESASTCPWKPPEEKEKKKLLRDIQMEEALQSKRQVEDLPRAQDSTLNCWGYCAATNTLPLVEMQLLQANHGPLDVLIEPCKVPDTITLQATEAAKKKSRQKRNRKEKLHIGEKKEKKERVRINSNLKPKKSESKSKSKSEYRVKERCSEKNDNNGRESQKNSEDCGASMRKTAHL
ncbi:unnamed protein product [Albugo candida]|uniref:Uncharacterized protein n=1 Tax=Albugo candida TaxID=65357 RepID=A0A024GIX4_9STRA|nr:unnamed protein product [Albugo candida]|eukprot:CCI46447.1 unnamed protein product [Albugo candida]